MLVVDRAHALVECYAQQFMSWWERRQLADQARTEEREVPRPTINGARADAHCNEMGYSLKRTMFFLSLRRKDFSLEQLILLLFGDAKEIKQVLHALRV